MSARSKSLAATLLLPLAVALVLGAALFSNAAIERFFTGQSTGRLSWGPTLFRALLAFHGLALGITGVLALLRVGPPATPPAAEAPERPSRTPWILLAALIVLALALRLWRLDSCLWYDEVITLLDFARPPLGVILTSFDSQNQHMLYSVLAHGSIVALGESAWALRLPAVVFGVASLWALFLFGRRVVGTTQALLACVLMTVSYHHIWFSQNARGYIGLLLFATLATWLWLEARERDQYRWWVSYAVAVSLGLLVHLTMVFVVAAHGLIQVTDFLYSIRLGRKSLSRRHILAGLGRPAGAWVLAATITLQVYSLSLPEFLATAAREGVATKSEWTAPFWWLKEGLRGMAVGWSGAIAVLLGGVLALSGWISIFRRDWCAALAMVLPGVLGGTTMILLGHPLWPRFFFFALGFALLIAVEGMMTLPRTALAWGPPLLRERVARGVGYGLVSLMIAASLLTLPRYYAIPKQDFIGARDYVESQRQPGDAVVAVGLAGIAYSRYFAPHWLVVTNKAELEEIRRRHANTWLVYTIPAQLNALNPDFWPEVHEQFKVVKAFPGTLSGGELVVCLPASSSADPAQAHKLGAPAR